MAKAMLIMDMPSSCAECPICRGVCLGGAWVCPIKDEDENERFFGEGDEERPSYCPLRELPKKLKVKDDKSMSEMLVKYGYNACIDEILGGGE